MAKIFYMFPDYDNSGTKCHLLDPLTNEVYYNTSEDGIIITPIPPELSTIIINIIKEGDIPHLNNTLAD